MHNVIILQKLTKNEFNVAETVLNYYVHEQGENLTFWGPKFCEDCDTPKYTYIYIYYLNVNRNMKVLNLHMTLATVQQINDLTTKLKPLILT
jgi:hypothetical protein